MKLTFMEEFLKIKDENIVRKLAATLQREKRKAHFPAISNFSGMLDDDDAQTFMDASQECRKIDKDEW